MGIRRRTRHRQSLHPRFRVRSGRRPAAAMATCRSHTRCPDGRRSCMSSRIGSCNTAGNSSEAASGSWHRLPPPRVMSTLRMPQERQMSCVRASSRTSKIAFAMSAARLAWAASVRSGRRRCQAGPTSQSRKSCATRIAIFQTRCTKGSCFQLCAKPESRASSIATRMQVATTRISNSFKVRASAVCLRSWPSTLRCHIRRFGGFAWL
mmetsp:Transcript_106727/g.299944  ORF Transcript_106727/g.299944 Transcript_106727/m.299944 type:complete len:208 (-) Transcript_106727:1321-1944(-)